MYVYRTSRPLLKTYTVKYKPSHPILFSQKIICTQNISAELQVKKPFFFCSIRCYTCIQIFRHKLHSHKIPSHVFINCLKAETFSAFLIRGGSLFHIFGPRTLKLFCQILIGQFLRLSNSNFTDNGQVYQIIYLPQCLTKKHGFN